MRLPPRGVVPTATGALHCPKTCSALHFASFFSVFSCVSHFASVFAVFLPTLDFLHMPDHAGFDLHLSFSSVQGWGGGGGQGVITSMRMRLVSSVFCCCFLCAAFRIGFYGVFADSRLFAHASLDLHLSFSSVRG